MPVLSRLLRQERVPSFRTSPTDPGIPYEREKEPLQDLHTPTN